MHRNPGSCSPIRPLGFSSRTGSILLLLLLNLLVPLLAPLTVYAR